MGFYVFLTCSIAGFLDGGVHNGLRGNQIYSKSSKTVVLDDQGTSIGLCSGGQECLKKGKSGFYLFHSLVRIHPSNFTSNPLV